jgi:hypothetical protein
MATDEVHKGPDSTDLPGAWSLRSTEESVASGQRNVWAIAESITAIILFWYLALNWESIFLLYSSLFMAPLLFLRSDASIKLGVDWFENGFIFANRLDTSKIQTAKLELPLLWATGCTAVFVGYFVVKNAAKMFLGELFGWSAFGHGLIVLYVLWNLAAALIFPAKATKGWSGNANANAKTGLLDIIFVGVIAGASGGLVAHAWSGSYVGLFAAALTGTFMSSFVEFARKERRKVEVEPLSTDSSIFKFIAFVFFPGAALGVLVQSQVIRFLATMRRFGDGFAAMPRNISNLCLNTSPGQWPELLPGLPKGHEFRLETVYSELKKSIFSPGWSGKGELIILPFVFLFWFLPGWAYRFILKSTLWFWWILYIIGGSPDVSGGLEGLRADVKIKWQARLNLFISALFLLPFLISLLKPFASNKALSAPMLPLVALLPALFDLLAKAALPFITFTTFLITIFIWFWADNLLADDDVPGRNVSTGLLRIGFFIKVKRALGLSSIGLLMLYIFLAANAAHSWIPVSPFGCAWLEFLYGKYAAALMPIPQSP